MTRYVIDAPTLLTLVEHETEVDATHQLVAPNGIRSQALQLLLERVSEGALAEGTALRHHERLTGVRMRLLGDRMSRRTAWNLAREHGWGVLAPAEYIAVTMLQADALVTVDDGLAALARGLVPLRPFEALSRPGGILPVE